jgi:hypothetical protein
MSRRDAKRLDPTWGAERLRHRQGNYKRGDDGSVGSIAQIQKNDP